MLNSLYQKRSVLVAALIALAAVVWVMSGGEPENKVAPNHQDAREANQAAEIPAVEVSVKQQQAQATWAQFEGAAVIEAQRSANVLSGLEGRVVEILANEGDRVSANDVLIKLSPKQIPQNLALAKARLAQAELQYRSSKQLASKGLQNELRVAEAKTALEQAKTDVAAAKVAVRELGLRAPFGGTLETVDVELGDYIRAGDRGARVVQAAPLKVVTTVMAEIAAQLAVGNQLEVLSKAAGAATPQVARIDFVASEPDPASRLYRVEAELPENSSGLVVGQPVDVRIPLREVPAHALPASLLWLNAEGDLGVRAVGADNRVQFYPAELLRTEGDLLWLTGLPSSLNVIVAGQGLVRTGGLVTPVSVASAPNATVSGGR